MDQKDEEMAVATPESERREEALAALCSELRRLVRESDKTQRAIEKEHGYTRGYLSQVLNGHVSLTARHVLAILFSLEIEPGAFFSRMFPVSKEPEDEEMLSEIRQRMARYDSAIEELEESGLLQRDEP